jgi:drug/metabolite transporter (DMT)-like permease
MNVKHLFGLLFCNALWSLAYPVSKVLFSHGYHPSEVSFLRNFVGGTILLILLPIFYARQSKSARSRSKLDFASLLRLLAIGVLTFFASPILQMVALHLSRATDSSVMIATEPLATLLVAAVLLGESLSLRHAIAFFFAIVGVLFLTEVSFKDVGTFTSQRMMGNGILLLAMFGEAAYSALSKKLLDRFDGLEILFRALWVGVIGMFFYNLLSHDFSRFSGIYFFIKNRSTTDAFAFLFLGGGCTVFGYLYWMNLLKKVPLSLMALTLYFQPVLGVLWGVLWLKEPFSVTSLFGAVILMGAVWFGSVQSSETK